LWVGAEYQAGAIVSGILAFGYLMHSFASTAPLTLSSLDRIGITVKIGIGEALGCVILTAALPGLFGLGLAGMALGATLPRLFSNLIMYPRFAVDCMGPELKPDMWRGLGRNLALCAAVTLAFLGVHWLLPGNTWPSLVASVAIVTVGHVFFLGHRYEAFPFVERFNQRAHAALRRLVPGGGA
jgi:hypothetical protein